MTLDTEIADVEAILAPFASDLLAGVDIRADAANYARYRGLRDVYQEARDAERQADRDGAGVSQGATDEELRENWRPVVEQAAQILTELTKDLGIAVWLTEGLVRLAGLSGLATGSTIISGLVERFWDGLFPQPDVDDPEARLIAAKGLDGKLLQTLRKLALFERPDGSRVTVWQYEATLRLEQLDVSLYYQQEIYDERVHEGVLPIATVEAEARHVAAVHWVSLRSSAEQAKRAWIGMGDAFRARIDANDPDRDGKTVGTTQVAEVLDIILEVCNRFAPRGEAADDAAPMRVSRASGTASV